VAEGFGIWRLPCLQTYDHLGCRWQYAKPESQVNGFAGRRIIPPPVSRAIDSRQDLA